MPYRYTSSVEQAATMQLLLASHPTLLRRDEIHREIGDPIAVDDALAYFERMLLVHRVPAHEHDFFFASRGAMAAEEVSTLPIDPPHREAG